MRALQMSSGKTSAEIEKMLEQGQLTEEYIMPMVMAMGKLAEANGAYSKALQKLGTVENRLKTTAAFGAARIGEAGFTEGLINLYETLMKTMEENGLTADELGKIYGKLFKGLAALIKMLVPVVESFIRALGTLTDILSWLSDNKFPATILALGLVAKGFTVAAAAAGGFGAAIMAAMARPLVLLMGMVAVLDEVRAYFDPNVHGLLDDQSLSVEEQKRVHAQRNVMFGIGTKEDYDILGRLGYKQETGLAGSIQKLNMMGGGIDPATGKPTDWLSRLQPALALGTSPMVASVTDFFKTQANSKEFATVNINVYESGDTEKTKKAIQESLEQIYSINKMADY